MVVEQAPVVEHRDGWRAFHQQAVYQLLCGCTVGRECGIQRRQHMFPVGHGAVQHLRHRTHVALPQLHQVALCSKEYALVKLADALLIRAHLPRYVVHSHVGTFRRHLQRPDAIGREYHQVVVAHLTLAQCARHRRGGGLAVAAGMSDFVFMEGKSAKLYVNSPNALAGNKEEDTAAFKKLLFSRSSIISYCVLFFV